MSQRLRRYRSCRDLGRCGTVRDGSFYSRWHQGLAEGMEWLRLSLDAPEAVDFRVWAADDPSSAPEAPALTGTGRDVLLYGVSGRYLRFAVTPGEGLRGYELAFPGLSLDAALPAAMRGDGHLRRLLGVYQSLAMDLAGEYARFPRRLDPESDTALPGLPLWVGARWAENAPEGVRRALVAAAPRLNALRGTRRGLAELLELTVGAGCRIVEGEGWQTLALDRSERSDCRRLYGPGVTVLLPQGVREETARFLETVLEDFVPAGVGWALRTLEEAGTLDELCFLDDNAALTQPPPPVLDGGTLAELTLE